MDGVVKGLRRKGLRDANLPQGERRSAPPLSSLAPFADSGRWYLCKISAAEPLDPSARRNGGPALVEAIMGEDPISGSRGTLDEAASNESCGSDVEDLTGRLNRPPTEKTDDENEKMEDGLADRLGRRPRTVVR